MSEGTANLAVGSELLKHHLTDQEADPAKVRDLLALLVRRTARSFWRPVASGYLNTANAELDRNEAAKATTVKRFPHFFREDPQKKEAIFRHLARFASRLYLFALEAITALSHPQIIAGVRHVGAEYNLPTNCTLAQDAGRPGSLGVIDCCSFPTPEGRQQPQEVWTEPGLGR